MKIVHIVVVGPYTEGMTYQENLLPQCQVQQGHEVIVIANCTMWQKSRVVNTEAEDTYLENGIRLIRLPFVRIGNAYLTEKLRFIRGLYDKLKEEKPKLIYLHDFETGTVFQIRKYLNDNPETALVIDSHVSAVNSAQSTISRVFLHKMIYRSFGRKIYQYARKIYYVGEDEKHFLLDIYRFPEDKLQLLPLGGIILAEADYLAVREEVRKRYKMQKARICMVHSGKLDPPKKTQDLLEAYINRTNKDSSELYIVGDTEDKVYKRKILDLIEQDESIHYLGWKSGDELKSLLCAADVYIQPGTPSATLQTAMCCRCGILAKSYPLYKELFSGRGMLFSKDEELQVDIDCLCADPSLITRLRETCFQIAQRELDYSLQSERIIQDAFCKTNSES